MATVKNYGMKVKVRFSEEYPYRGVGTYRNVTEIHWMYIDGKRLEDIPTKKQIEESGGKFGDKIAFASGLRGPKVAFESAIHQRGVSYPIDAIEEFETELEFKKAKEFQP